MTTTGTWRQFSEARELVRSLGLKKSTEYGEWIKSPERPLDIPSTPRRAYPNEWMGWQDWLGTGSERRSPPVTLAVARAFCEAREFVRSLGLKSASDYEAWAKSSARPPDIPSTPRRVYKSEWEGWADWLGTKGPRITSRSSRSAICAFSVARDYMRRIGLQGQKDFFAWSRENRPEFIPSNPQGFYQEKWTNWGDFLGYSQPVRSFQGAREYARTLNLQKKQDWLDFSSTPEFPKDLPAWPSSKYRNRGWIGWGDFLGQYNQWNHHSIPAFLDSLKPLIADLDELELYLILSRNGMLKRRGSLYGSRIMRSLAALRTEDDIEHAKASLSEELDQEYTDETDADDAPHEEQNEVSYDEVLSGKSIGSEESSLRILKTIESLKLVDKVAEAHITDDEELVEFMIRNRVAALWHAVVDGRFDPEQQRLRSHEGGKYFCEIKERFFAEYDQVQNLPLPVGYSFRDPSGEIALPNLMQKLTTLRLINNRRLGNWSGVGSGKTKAAIVAAGVMQAELTLVLAANATREGWEQQIRDVFTDDRVAIHATNPREFAFQSGKMNFLIVNYESMQQKWSETFVSELTAQHKVDLIVLDEVQSARQRYAADFRKSKRRSVVEGLVAEIVHRNPEVRILAMSATPIVNNLREGIKTLELLHPERDFSAVPDGASIANAVGVHMLLMEHGIRYVPRYEQEMKQTTVPLDGMCLLTELQQVPARDILRLEQILLKAKIPALPQWVRRGTLIYTHFVNGIVEPLTNAVESMGLSVRHFTGDSRVAIQEFVADFRAGKADVLIGSAPVGTGVDNLQFVLDRLVFISLPWSQAEYQQIVGRLWRQGSTFNKIDVIIPQVVLREERAGQWSWDDLRLRCIEYKRTLADAALDGVIPQGGLPSKEEMQRRSLLALRKWIDEYHHNVPDAAGTPIGT